MLQVAALVRVGPLVLGSDNLSGLLGLTSATEADVYFGLALALRRVLGRNKASPQPHAEWLVLHAAAM